MMHIETPTPQTRDLRRPYVGQENAETLLLAAGFNTRPQSGMNEFQGLQSQHRELLSTSAVNSRKRP